MIEIDMRNLVTFPLFIDYINSKGFLYVATVENYLDVEGLHDDALEEVLKSDDSNWPKKVQSTRVNSVVIPTSEENSMQFIFSMDGLFMRMRELKGFDLMDQVTRSHYLGELIGRSLCGTVRDIYVSPGGLEIEMKK